MHSLRSAEVLHFIWADAHSVFLMAAAFSAATWHEGRSGVYLQPFSAFAAAAALSAAACFARHTGLSGDSLQALSSFCCC